MTARTIETKAIISAEDKSGQGFASFLRNLHNAEKATKDAHLAISGSDRAAAREAAMARRAELAHAREVVKVQREIEHHGVRKYVAQTAATAVAAHSVIDVIKDSVKAGASYQHEITAIANAGFKDHLAEISKAARDTAQQIPTSTYTDNLKVINETTSAFGSLHHAIENLPFMQKSASVLQAAMPEGSHVDAGELGNKMARAFEERGTAGNSEVFKKEASEVMRAMAFSGGKFNPNEFLNFAQQAKSSLQNYDLQFLSRVAPSIIGTTGGERAGTAANAFTSVIMGKANDAKQAEEWAKYGLLDKSQAIMKKGKITSWRAGAVTETDLALRNPLEWAEKVALPAMKAKGVNVDDRMSLVKVLGTMFRNQNSNMFANEIMQPQQRSRLHKDAGLIDNAGTLDEIYSRNLKEDPTVAIKALAASLENLVTTVSAPAMSTVAGALTSFASGIQAVSGALKDHPLLAMATGGTLAGGALAGSGYAAYSLANGFGLSASATALDESAVALSGAAARLGAAGGLSSAEHAADHWLGGGAAGTAGELAKKGGIFGLGTLGSAGLLTAGGLAFAGGMMWGADAYKKANPDEFHAHAWGAYGHRSVPHAGMHMTPARRGDNGHWVSDVGNNDFTLGSTGSFSKGPPAGGTIGGLSRLSADTLHRAGGMTEEARKPQPQMVHVSFDQIPPIKMESTVTASSTLLQVVDGAKQATAQLKAHASDTGPGGLGETHTGQ